MAQIEAEAAAVDPNSMSWPEPKIVLDWHYDGAFKCRARTIRYTRPRPGYEERCDETIYDMGDHFWVGGVGSYKTYQDAEAAVYFWVRYSKTRDRGRIR